MEIVAGSILNAVFLLIEHLFARKTKFGVKTNYKWKLIIYEYKFMYFHKELSASVSYMVMDEQKAWLISVTSFFLLYLFFSPTTVFLWSEKVALLFLS